MRKTIYQEPTMLIVQLQHAHILMTSGVEASRSGYGEANEQTWGEGSGVKASGNSDVWDKEW